MIGASIQKFVMINFNWQIFLFTCFVWGMNISSVNNSLTFGANLNSPKLNFSKKDFYVRIKGYGKNKRWANEIIQTANISVGFIRHHYDFEKVLRSIAYGVRRANKFTSDQTKIAHTSALRIDRDGWRSPSKWKNFTLCTYYDGGKYKTYEKRIDEIKYNPLKNPYPDIDLTVPVFEEGEKFLQHGRKDVIENVFNHLSGIYKEFSHFTKIDVQQEHLPKINDQIATMRWILAHATPWERGSDAIANVLMRAMYKSVGVKSYPLAKGVSLDMEAYCTNLADYKKKFPKYFAKPPVVISNKKTSFLSKISSFFKS